MFEQDVAGLVKALRANENDQHKVIKQTVDEARQEIRSPDMETKWNAVLKLVYLEMLGVNIQFASFPIVECMASTSIEAKCVGYLAASQCFTNETEVAVLVVNLMKKDLMAPPVADPAVVVPHFATVLSAAPLILTPSLAADLAPDFFALLSHSRPQVRKYATLNLFSLYNAWPQVAQLPSKSLAADYTDSREESPLGTSLPSPDTSSLHTSSLPTSSLPEAAHSRHETAFVDETWVTRIREQLNDENPAVVMCAVNLVCELARKDPMPYLALAPDLFFKLTTHTNNWVLIKIIKLFARMATVEPRLVRKLAMPLGQIIETTSAMSLLYESITTCIEGGLLNEDAAAVGAGPSLAVTCVAKLQGFLRDSDQNLRYMALLALAKMVPAHRSLLLPYYERILVLTDDPDLSTRQRALHIIEHIVDADKLPDVVDRFINFAHKTLQKQKPASASAQLGAVAEKDTMSRKAKNALHLQSLVTSSNYKYAGELLWSIVRMSLADTYANVVDFEWLVDVLLTCVDLARNFPVEPVDSFPLVHAQKTSFGSAIRHTLIDIVLRVRQVRPYAVKQMVAFLDAPPMDLTSALVTKAGLAHVLAAASFIAGEYAADLDDARPLIATLLAPRHDIPAFIKQVYLQNGIKVYGHWLAALAQTWFDDPDANAQHVAQVTQALISSLTDLATTTRGPRGFDLLVGTRKTHDSPSVLLDLSLRASQFTALLNVILANVSETSTPPLNLFSEFYSFFSDFELSVVNPRAQSLVAPPPTLDFAQQWGAPSQNAGPLLDLMHAWKAPPAPQGAVDDYGRPKLAAAKPPKQKKKTSHDKSTKSSKVKGSKKKASLSASALEHTSAPEPERPPSPKAWSRPVRMTQRPLVQLDGELPEMQQPATTPSMSSPPGLSPTPESAPQAPSSAPVVKVKKKKKRPVQAN